MVVAVTFAHFDEQIADQLLRSANTAGGLSTFRAFGTPNSPPVGWWQRWKPAPNCSHPSAPCTADVYRRWSTTVSESCSTPSFRRIMGRHHRIQAEPAATVSSGVSPSPTSCHWASAVGSAHRHQQRRQSRLRSQGTVTIVNAAGNAQ